MAGNLRRTTKVGLLAAAFAIGASQGAEAQAGLLGPGAVFLGVGASGIQTDELDARLAARGYPTFGESAVGVSLGAYRVLGSGIMLGGEWHGLIVGDDVHEGREVGVGGGYGTLGVGYMVDLSPRARVYPRLGVGGGALGLWIESPAGEVGFDEVLASPTSHAEGDRHTVMNRGSMAVDLGGGAEFFLGRGGRGPLLGLRVGYLAAPSAGDWRLDEMDTDRLAKGGPDASFGGPYVRVVVGVGWRRQPGRADIPR